MSTSNATLAETNSIIYINHICYQIWSYLLISLGTIGHSLNIYVFTRPILRSNPCTRYLLAATISGIVVIYFNVLFRLIQVIYPAYSPFGYSTTSCKILSFIVFCARCNASWFIVLASIDRFLCSSSSATIRRWSNVRVASRTTVLMPIVVGLFYIYVPIHFENIQTRTKCPASQTTYPLFSGIWNLLIYSLCPSLIMLIFGSLTIRHVRQSRTKIASSPKITQVDNQLKLGKTTDRQLIKMMFVQCLYFSLLTTPVSVFYLYSALRNSIVSDALQNAKDNAFSNIAGLSTLTCACTSFYVFTLSSRLFRSELMHLFKCCRLTNSFINTNVMQLTTRK